MTNSEFPDLPQSEIESIDALFETVDWEQKQMPEWFAGLPLDSAPAAMAIKLVQEIDDLVARPDTEVGNTEKMKVAHNQLNILSNFHAGYRALIMDECSPITAIDVQAEVIGSALEDGIYPFKNSNTVESASYLGLVIQAYRQFYLPSSADIATD